MTSSIDEKFDHYRRRLVISEDDLALAQDLEIAFREALSKSGIVRGTQLVGSYPRKTAAGRLKDVDLFVIFDSSKMQQDLGSCKTWLSKELRRLVKDDDAIKAALHRHGMTVSDIDDTQSCSIGMTLTSSAGVPAPGMDFIPAFQSTDKPGYRIWRTENGTRFTIQTNPPLVAEKLQVVSQEYPQIIDVIRVLKELNARLKTESIAGVWTANGHKPVKSVFLEVAIYDAFSKGDKPKNLREALERAFGYLAGVDWATLVVPGSEGQTPTPPEGMTVQSWASSLKSLFSGAFKIAYNANHPASVEEWRRLFPEL